jgi:glyoxylase-like metal-dependent hydrolase (beta-lactamase superfamily II)
MLMALKFKVVPVTLFQQNCTLLWCDETMHAAIVDPGGDIPRILSAVEKNKLIPQKILLTHGHFDHVAGAAELAKALSIPIEGPHQEDQFWIDGLSKQALQFGSPGMVEDLVPDRWLAGGDKVEFGKVTMDVLHCPGHTPGHVAYYNKEAQLAQVGDVLFHGSIGRTDFPRGDYHTLISSIRTKFWPLGDDVEFISGHGPMSTFGYERRTNPFCSD